MPYAQGRVYHDADAHVMETPELLRTPSRTRPVRARSAALRRDGEARRGALHRRAARGSHREADYRAREADEIMLRKNWRATGSFLKEDRPRALDLLGFASQLVFNTFLNKYLLRSEQGERPRLRLRPRAAPTTARWPTSAPSTARLLAVGYVPLADFERARAHGARGARARLQGADGPVRLPARALAEPRRARPGLGARRRRPASRSSSTSAAAGSCCTRATSRTGSRPCRTSTAARRTSARSTTWRSPTRPCRPSRR